VKSNNFKVYEKMSGEELNKELKNLQEALLKIRFKKVVEENVDTSQSRKTRKQIAQINTILRNRETKK